MDAYDFAALGIELAIQREEEDAHYKEQERKQRSQE